MKRSQTPAIDIDDQPGHNIRRLHQISVGIFLQELGEMGITPVQYAALQTVATHPGIDQRTLARTIALDTSTTGGVVDRLEARGCVERRTSPEDRRARQPLLPAAKNGFTRARLEVEVAAQIQKAGLGHDMFALLVLLDRLGVGAEPLEENVARLRCARFPVMEPSACCSTQTSRSGADNCNLEMADATLMARCHTGLLPESPLSDSLLNETSK